jgi:membrane protein
MSAIAARLTRAATGTWRVYSDAAGGQHAAAISYHVLFSLVPFVALFVALGELVLSETTQGRLASWLTESLPLPEGVQEGAENVIADAGPAASLAGIIALLGLFWGASGMMSSIRAAFTVVWADEHGDPYLRGKLVDLSLVLGAGVVAVSAFGLTVIAQFVASASTELAAELGGRDDVGALVGRLAQLGGSLALAFVAFLLLYEIAPPVPTRLRETAPGALVATVGFQLANAGFSLYLAHVADFDDVYGPLGAVLAFVLLVYVTAAVLLAGACFAVAWPRSADPDPEPSGPSLPLRRRLLEAARGLVVRDKRSPG